MNIKEAISDAASRLGACGVADPRREAGTLLSFALGRDRVFAIANPGYELSDSELRKYADAVERRSAREPFHLIIGSREFFGHEFLVEKGVLIPRPEAEILVEHAIASLPKIDSPRFLEVGVGTGCIAVSILKALPRALCDAVDVSEQALALAKRNAERHGVLGRLSVSKADLFEGAGKAYDMIVSNPPYIPERDRPMLEPEVSNFDPPAALFSGVDGLDLIRRIVKDAPEHLTPEGCLLLEIGGGQSPDVAKLFNSNTWKTVEFVADLQGIARVVRVQRRF